MADFKSDYGSSFMTALRNMFSSTPGGTEALRTIRGDLAGGERDDYRRHFTLRKCEYAHLTTNATTQQVTGAVLVVGVIVGKAGTGSTVQLIDNTSGTSPIVIELDTSALRTVDLGVEFATGLRIVTAGTAAADITVLYQRPNVE